MRIDQHEWIKITHQELGLKGDTIRLRHKAHIHELREPNVLPILERAVTVLVERRGRRADLRSAERA